MNKYIKHCKGREVYKNERPNQNVKQATDINVNLRAFMAMPFGFQSEVVDFISLLPSPLPVSLPLLSSGISRSKTSGRIPQTPH